MKMYHFKRDYGESYSVVAPTKEKAFEYVQLFMNKRCIAYEESGLRVGKAFFEQWKDASAFSLPRGYHLYEYGVGDVNATDTFA